MAKLLILQPNTDSIGRQSIPTALISALLKKNNHTVELFDTTFMDARYLYDKNSTHEDVNVDLGFFKDFKLKGKNFDFSKKKIDIVKEFEKKVESFKPDFISFSHWGSQLHGEGEFYAFFHGIKIIEKSKISKIPIFVGGTAPTYSVEETLKNFPINYIVRGEAENVFLEIANTIDQKKDITKIENLSFLENNKVTNNPLRPLINPDDLPHADFDIYDERTFYRPFHGKIYRCLDYELSRGCLYNCTFCISPFQRKTYGNPKNFRREKSIEKIIDEISYLKQKYNLEIIRYQDETFLSMKEDKLEQLAEIYKSKVNLPFIIEATINTVTEKKLKSLKKMGCLSISFGLESGNEKLRKDIIRKPNFTNKQAVENLKLVKKYGISFNVFNMIGFPEETTQMIYDTIEVNYKVKPPYCQVGYFQPWEGVSLREYSIDKNYLSENSKGLENSKDNLLSTPMKNLLVTKEKLKHLHDKFQLYVYFNKIFWPLINLTENKNIFSKIIYNIFIRILKLRFKFVN